MLVLTRREGTRLFVGDDITITIVGIAGNEVRIGIQAPPDVRILREEVADRFRENEEKQ